MAAHVAFPQGLSARHPMPMSRSERKL